jgi:hypothetical protein
MQKGKVPQLDGNKGTTVTLAQAKELVAQFPLTVFGETELSPKDADAYFTLIPMGDTFKAAQFNNILFIW